MLNKEQWFAAHRKHAYQRLKQYGFSTRVILLGQLLLNLFFLALLMLVQQGIVPVELVLGCNWVLFYLSIYLRNVRFLCMRSAFKMIKAEAEKARFSA